MTKIDRQHRVVNVGLLRRDESDLTQTETILCRSLSSVGVTYIRLDSVDSEHHARLCKDHSIDFVILPRAEPIPTQAMKDGVKHLTVMGDGWNPRLLTEVNPTFESILVE
jgi:hypothetical protein